MSTRAPQPTRNPVAIGIAFTIAAVLIVWVGIDDDDPRQRAAERTATAGAALPRPGGIQVVFVDAAGRAVPGGCLSVEAVWGFDAVCDGDDADRDPEPGGVLLAFFGPDGAADANALVTLYPPPGHALIERAPSVRSILSSATVSRERVLVGPEPPSPVASPAAR